MKCRLVVLSRLYTDACVQTRWETLVDHPTHRVCQIAPAKEREETNTKENKEKGVVGGSEIKEQRQTCAGVVCVVVEAAKR
jgi:hypothetical protein